MTGHVLRLHGCAPTPLGSYLKALGVFRLVGTHADRAARACWREDRLELFSRFDEDGLFAFFLDSYPPSPVISPWNSDGGFSRTGKRSSEANLAAIAGSTDARLGSYREAIAAAWELVDDPRWAGWDKGTQVRACRNRLPDAALDWVDAAVVLTDGDPTFPPILGTGGNLGRLELSSNYMQRVLDVLGAAPKRPPSLDQRRAWLEQSLFGRGRPKPVPGVVGQYDPGQAAHGTVNPWDFVLLVEGALLFASGVARSAGSDGRSFAAMPFTVRATPVGHGTAAVGESAKGEIWAPLWPQPAGLGQVSRLFREGRLRMGRADARTGLDAARAAASLGVDRGVAEFARHALVERFGQSILAVPAGRLRVVERAEVSTLASLDWWLRRVRSVKELPAHAASALRAVERAEYEVAAAGGADRMLAVLRAVAELHTAVSRSGRLRGDIPPLSGLRAVHWLPHIEPEHTDDGGVEFRLAAVFASLRAADGTGLRDLLHPLIRRDRRLEWSGRPPAVAGFGARRLVDVLADAHTARVVRQTQHRRGTRDDTPLPPFEHGRWASRGDLDAFLTGRIDSAAMQDHLAALLLLDWPTTKPNDAKADTAEGNDPDPAGQPAGNDRPAADNGDVPHPPVRPAGGWLPAEPAWRLLAPFYAGIRIAPGSTDPGVRLSAGPGWARQLQAGAVAEVLEDATRRLRAARLRPLVQPDRIAVPADPRTLSAALLPRLRGEVAADVLASCSTHELPN